MQPAAHQPRQPASVRPTQRPVHAPHERHGWRFKLPYGNIPRLLLAYITTEAVRTQSRVLVLEDSLFGVHAEARHLQYQRQGTHAAPQSDGPALSRFGDVDVRRRAESSALRARRWRSCSRAVSRLTSRSWCWPWRLLVRQVAMADAADTSKARTLTVSVTGSSTPKNRSSALNASWRPLTACGGYSPLKSRSSRCPRRSPRRRSGRRAWSCAGSHARRFSGRARACRH